MYVVFLELKENKYISCIAKVVYIYIYIYSIYIQYIYTVYVERGYSRTMVEDQKKRLAIPPFLHWDGTPWAPRPSSVPF